MIFIKSQKLFEFYFKKSIFCIINLPKRGKNMVGV
jgi:hypothetical protein